MKAGQCQRTAPQHRRFGEDGWSSKHEHAHVSRQGPASTDPQCYVILHFAYYRDGKVGLSKPQNQQCWAGILPGGNSDNLEPLVPARLSWESSFGMPKRWVLEHKVWRYHHLCFPIYHLYNPYNDNSFHFLFHYPYIAPI